MSNLSRRDALKLSLLTAMPFVRHGDLPRLRADRRLGVAAGTERPILPVFREHVVALRDVDDRYLKSRCQRISRGRNLSGLPRNVGSGSRPDAVVVLDAGPHPRPRINGRHATCLHCYCESH